MRVPAEGQATVLSRLRSNPEVQTVEKDLVNVVPQSRTAYHAPEPGTVTFSAVQSARATRRPKCSRVAVLDTGVDARHPLMRRRIVHSFDVLRHSRPHLVTQTVTLYMLRASSRRAEDASGGDSSVASVPAPKSSRFDFSTDTAEVLRQPRMRHWFARCTFRFLILAHYSIPVDSTIIAAAGNDSIDIDHPPRRYPAAYAKTEPDVISVAATVGSPRLARFSNFGRRVVDLSASDTAVLSTWRGGSYRFASGTSMATPQLSAASAALRRRHQWDPDRIRRRLFDTVRPCPCLTRRLVSGGALNSDRATR